ncbi:MAG: GNAT family N-acetyltransferase [Bacteroidales bacterium]|jgi:ribosomal protein S18 acetylase RimI-like enzyme|nr:GNAT family N-acetyltransferase [Bacteroidales bacterium]
MITIRKAQPDDATDIAVFQHEMAWETERIRLDHVIVASGVNAVFIDSSKGQYYVAEDEGKVVASLLITYEWSDWRNTYIWWFQSVYVRTSHRRRGIFSSMYRHIRNEADKKGIAGLRLYVESNNLNACKTYESLGMTSEHYKLYEWLKD